MKKIVLLAVLAGCSEAQGGQRQPPADFEAAAANCRDAVASCAASFSDCDAAKFQSCADQCGSDRDCFETCYRCEADRASCVSASDDCSTSREFCEDAAHVLAVGDPPECYADLDSKACRDALRLPAPIVCLQRCPDGVGAPADGCDYEHGEECTEIDLSPASASAEDVRAFVCYDSPYAP
jgi:hypothetical protein